MERVAISTVIDSVSAATETCESIRSTLSDFAQDFAGLENAVKELGREVHCLSATFGALGSSLEKVSSLPSWTETIRDREAWTAVHSTAMECNGHLEALDSLLGEIQGDEGQEGWLPSTMRAVRLSASKEELGNHHPQIQDDTKQARLALTVTNL